MNENPGQQGPKALKYYKLQRFLGHTESEWSFPIHTVIGVGRIKLRKNSEDWKNLQKMLGYLSTSNNIA